MYTITIDGRPFFSPIDRALALEAPLLTLEANTIGTLTFTIYPDHPEYENIRIMRSVLTVRRDGEIISQLRPLHSHMDMQGGIEWTCEELTGLLNDIMRRPTFRNYSGNESTYINAMLTEYGNTRGTVTPEGIEINMTFLLGSVTYVDGTETVEHKSEDYIGFWDLLQRELIEEHEGAYLVPRWGDTTCYLDYLSVESLPLSEQTIKFGENMADLFIDTDGEETFSVLIPLGGQRTIGDMIPPPSSPTGNTTIKSENEGKDYLENAAALAAYGRREIIKEWSDITSPRTLKSTAQKWFDENVMKLKKSVSMNAFELRYAGVDVEYLTFLTRVPAESKFHGLQQEYPLSRMEIPLDSPTALSVGLGDDRDMLTDTITDRETTDKESYTRLDSRITVIEDFIQGSGGE